MINSDNQNEPLQMGVLKSILQVDYGLDTIVAVMEASWIKPIMEGPRTIKKDMSSFWIVKFNFHKDPSVQDSYVLVTNVS